ncbi:MAG: sigma-70 family RNA polymerase sigma factor [Planctomycetota bacterium]
MDAESLSQHAAFVRRLAGVLTRNEDEAEEVLQQTMLRALESPPAHTASIRGWLSQITRNVVRQSRRGQTRRHRREQASARGEVDAKDPGLEAERRELILSVAQAVLALREPYQTAIFERYYHDRSPQEIARQHDVPVTTVASWLKRGRILLRESLDRRSGGDRGRWTLALAGWIASTDAVQASVTTSTISLTGAALMKSKVLAVAFGILAIAVSLWWYTDSLDSSNSDRDLAYGSDRRRPGNEAAASNLESSSSSIEAENGKGGPPSDLASETPRLFGRVEDKSGQGIAGATLTVHPQSLRTIGITDSSTWDDEASEHRTDATGAFEIPLGDRSPSLNVCVCAPGFAPQLFQGEPPEERTYTLAPSFALVGRVRDRQGAPAADLSVHWSGELSWQMKLELSAQTDAEGRFRIDGLPDLLAIRRSSSARVSTIHVERDGVPLVWQQVPPHSADSRREIAIDLFLPRDATLTGIVRRTDGSPVAAAEVLAHSGSGSGRSGYRRTQADESGRFRIEGLPPGQTPVFAWADALAPGVVRPELTEGDSKEVEIRCQPERRITGRVVDEAGRPVAGASVTTDIDRVPADIVGAPRAIGRTDADGHYAIEGIGLEPGQSLALSARTRLGRLRGSVDVTLEEASLTKAPDVVVRETVHARIRVLDPGGSPVFGAFVIPLSNGTDYGWTDRDGEAMYRIEWTEDEPQPVRVSVVANGYAVAESPVFYASKEEPPLIEVTLQPEYRIRGWVLGPDGTPAPHATIYVEETRHPEHLLFQGRDTRGSFENLHADPQSPTAVSGADGCFELRHLLPGTYRLRAHGLHDERGRAEDVLAGSEDVTITLLPSIKEEPKPLAAFEVQVVDGRDDHPIISSKVFAMSGDHRLRQGKGTTDGTFVFEDRPFAPIDIEVTAPGFASKRLNAAAPNEAGGVRHVRVALFPGVSTPVRILPPSGVAAPRYGEILAIGLDHATRSKVAFDPTGEAVLEELAPGGHYRLEIQERRGFEPGGAREPQALKTKSQTEKSGKEKIVTETYPGGSVSVRNSLLELRAFQRRYAASRVPPGGPEKGLGRRGQAGRPRESALRPDGCANHRPEMKRRGMPSGVFSFTGYAGTGEGPGRVLRVLA